MVQSLSGDDGKVYGEPFYGESSFLMYRKDVMQDEGITVPAKPTWQEVADIAARVDGAQPDMAGICLRGQPGWGQVFAPLTTVVNTFGGTWFTEDWQAWTMSRSSRRPVLRRPGARVRREGRATSRVHRVPEQPIQGNVAMWYDATSAAGSLEAADSPVKGKIGYVAAPVVETDSSAGSTPGPGASRRPARRRTTPGSSSPGPPVGSTRSWSARSSGGRGSPPGSGPRRTRTRTT